MILLLVFVVGSASRGAEMEVRRPVLPASANTCAPDALCFWLMQCGVAPPGLDALRAELPSQYQGVAADRVVAAARANGVAAEGQLMTTRDVASLDRPAILHVNGDHYIVVAGRDGDRFLVFDNRIGLLDCSRKWFDRAYKWDGVAITTPVEPANGSVPPTILLAIGLLVGGTASFARRQVQLRSRLVGLFVLSATLAPPATADERGDLRDILRGVQARVNSYNPSRVQYHVDITYTPYSAAASGGFDPADRRLFDKLKEARIRFRGDNARSGPKYATRGDGPIVVVTTLDVSKTNRVSWAKCDGAIELRGASGDDSGHGIKNAVETTQKFVPPLHPFTEYTCEDQLLEFLDSIESPDFGTNFGVTVSDRTDGVAGATRHLTITQKFAGGGRYDFWLGPTERGYCVHKFERRAEDGLVYHQAIDIRYAEKNGVWYPTASTRNHYGRLSDGHHLCDSHRFTLDSVTFRPEDIPDSLFDTTPPVGATVIDRDRQKIVLTGSPFNPQTVIVPLDAEPATRLREGGSRYWVWIAVGVCGVAIVFGVLRRYGRRGRRTIPVDGRPGFSLLELLVVVAILGVLIGLTMAAVQKVRAASAKTVCANNLRQISLALHAHHDARGALPAGITREGGKHPEPFMGWSCRLLPYLDQQPLWDTSVAAFKTGVNFGFDPPHVGHRLAMSVYGCPMDERTLRPFVVNADRTTPPLPFKVGLTEYLGVEGVNQYRWDGLLFMDSKVKFADVTDGTSNTLMVGERPPSPDGVYGWWYAGRGMADEGTVDLTLGVQAKNLIGWYSCPPGPYEFGPGRLSQPCDMLHFWSLHPGGGQFAFADGSVRFLPYTARDILPALATRAGGETVSLPD